VASPLLVMGGIAVLTLAIGNVRHRAFGGEAYAMAFAANLFHNLMTYVAWAFDLRNPFFDDPGGISQSAWRVGLPVAAALLALAGVTRDRTRLPVIGLLWAALALAPVLPLIHHTYATYLYAPLAGAALAVGSGCESGIVMAWSLRARENARGKRRTGARAGHEVAVATLMSLAVLAYAIGSDRLLAARVTRRVEGLDLPFDRQLRKSEMIRRATAGLERAGGAHRIVLYLPPEASTRLDQRTGRMYSDTTLKLEQMLMVRVLDQGRALRALSPGLDSVAFVTRWSAAYADFDLCANTPAGDIVDFGTGPDAHLRLGALLMQSGKPRLAEDLLTSACAAYPQDPRLRRMADQTRAAP